MENKLKPLEFKNQRIMTTKVLAEQFGTNEQNISKNFTRNQSRFKEGKHFFKLEGQELKDFKGYVLNDESLKYVSVLYLWTDRGAARHAKILDTDEAWDVYEALEENYFNPREKKPQCIEDILISSLQEMKAMRQEINSVKEETAATRDEVTGLREAVTLNPNQWRKDTATLINKIANKLGGFQHIEPIRKEAYKLLNTTYGVDINRRLLNKKKNMALEGCSKTKIDKVNYLDVIAEDKKLINGYINIIGRMAVKYGIKEMD